MLKFSAARTRQFSCEKSGSAAVLFALALVPIILFVGFAVDYGRAMTVRGMLSDAADSAALAIGSWVDLTEAELELKAQQFFDANYASSLSNDIKSDFKVSFAGENLVVEASATVPTTFLRLGGFNNLDVGIRNTIFTRQRDVELALVLDTTGSMRNDGKIDALKTAANQMMDNLFGQKSVSDTLDVAVVPFAAAVNVGADKRNEDWLDVDAASSIATEDFSNGVKPFTFFNQLKSVRASWDWQGCVRERSGSTTYELTDATPGSGQPESMFVPYFAPDEPDSDHDDGDRYRNNYIDDGNCGEAESSRRTPEKCQRYTAKYSSPITTSGSGPNQHCPPASITALSDTKSTVTNAINALQPNGYTNIGAGLLWGWRVLSPTAPFTEGEPYDEDRRVKAVVVLTDGSNDPGRISNHNGTNYGAFGFAGEGHLGSTSGSEARSTLDEKTATVCANIKAAGILIYTIGFRVSSSSTHTLLRNCATQPDMYYNSPSNSQLALVFADIAQGLSELRIAQ